MRPVVVRATHRGAHLNVFQCDAISKVAVIPRWQQNLYVPSVPIHVPEPNLRRPPLAIRVAKLFFHGSPRAFRRPRLDFGFRNKLPVWLVHHEGSVHERHCWNVIPVLRFDVAFPQILRFMHVRIRINDFEMLPHFLSPFTGQWLKTPQQKRPYRLCEAYGKRRNE
jgi:hypothetical protein